MDCVLYLRVSSIAQDNQRQRDDLTSYANKMGYNIIREYSDKLSGFDDNRPGYLQLKSDSDSDQFDIILISEMSRMTRKNQLLAEVEYFKSKGKQIYFLAQNIHIKPDVNDLGTSILLSVLSAISSYEVSLFRERVASGRLAKCQSYNASLGEAGRGYLSIDGILQVDQTMIPIITQLFELYAGGMTASQVVDYVNDRELLPSKLSTKGLFDVIRNPQYKGMYIRTISGEQIERYEPSLRIVSDELWHKANEMRIVNKTNIATTKYDKEILFDNKMYCVCGERMVIRYSRHGTDYVCVHRSHHHIGKKCESSRTVRTKRVDDILWDVAKNYILVCAIGRYNSNALSEKQTRIANLNKDIDTVKKDIQSIEDQFNKYIKNAVKYNLSSEVMDTEHKNKTQTIKSLTNRLNKLIVDRDQCQSIIDYLTSTPIESMDSFDHLLAKADTEFDIRREQVIKHVERVTVIAIRKANVFIIKMMDGLVMVVMINTGVKSNKYYHYIDQCEWRDDKLYDRDDNPLDLDEVYDLMANSDEVMMGVNWNPYLVKF